MNRKQTVSLEKEQLYRISPQNIIKLIFIIGLSFRLLCLLNYGNALTLNSDDRNYIFGAINFLKHHHLTYGLAWPSEPSMITMPGMILLLSFFFRVFGYTQNALIVVRAILAILGSTSIVAVYKIGKKLFNLPVALIAAIFTAIWPPFIVMDNMFLTESPFMTCMLWFTYFTLKYCHSKKDSDFLLLLMFYFISLMFRNTIILAPVLFIFYFYNRKFPFKLLIKRVLYAILILTIVLTPWWYRNYKVVGKFVPTTGGSGDPLLGGTFIGDYPDTGISNSESRVQFFIKGERNALYNRMERQKEYAIKRIRLWWNSDKKAFLKSYLIQKPEMSWKTTYYPAEIFDLKSVFLNKLYNYICIIAAFSLIIGFRKHFQSILLCVLFISYTTIFCIVFLPYPRYIFPFIPFIFLLAAYTISNVYKFYKNIKTTIKLRSDI